MWGVLKSGYQFLGTQRSDLLLIMTITVFSVGHGKRSIEQLLALLHGADIRLLVDVRSQPVSSRHPHFDGDTLRA